MDIAEILIVAVSEHEGADDLTGAAGDEYVIDEAESRRVKARRRHVGAQHPVLDTLERHIDDVIEKPPFCDELGLKTLLIVINSEIPTILPLVQYAHSYSETRTKNGYIQQ